MALQQQMRTYPGRMVILPFVLVFVVLLTGCQSVPESSGTISAAVSILPLQFVVERIGGEYVDITVLVGSGQSPASYEPTPKQMAALSEADLFFGIGVPFEKAFMPKLTGTLPDLPVVDTRQGILLRSITDRDVHHDHHHHGADPHVWLDPRNVAVMARTVCTALITLDTVHAESYQHNLDSLLDDLASLHKRIAATLSPYRGRKLYVFHPAFGYFADAYGLKQVAVEVEGKEPGPRQLAELIDRARAEGVKVIFVQNQFPVNTTTKIAEAIGGEVVRIDPLSPDYLDNLDQIATAVVGAYRHE